MRSILLMAMLAGLPDRGIFPDLDPLVSTAVPPGTRPDRTWLRLDRVHGVLTLYDGADPVKAYRAAVPTGLRLAAETKLAALGLHPDGASSTGAAAAGVALRAEELAELSRFVAPGSPVLVQPPARAEDRDGDGIVNRLDVLLGARKLVANRARYIERYVSMRYPGGDVPRGEGVCSDTVIRALRNAGIDLQREVHEDILRARRSYPMVDKVDPSINHRRVRTLLPWFRRHFETLAPTERYLPGDVVFFDTFPERPGPDHIGIVADTIGPSGRPLVINNWTDGAVDAEMDLLSFVPVTHHLRAPSPKLDRAQR